MADRSAINAPIRTNRFEVELELPGGPVPGWRRIDLPTTSTQGATYREGPDPEYEFELTGNEAQDADLVMERGIKTGEMMLWDWHEKVRQGKLDEARKTIAVSVFDSTGNQTLARFEFTKAWPRRYEPPTLDAQAGNMGTETLVIAYDRYKRSQ